MKYVIFVWSVTLFNSKDKITRMIKYFNWQNKKKKQINDWKYINDEGYLIRAVRNGKPNA